jgi:hypothetical protein
MPTGQSHAARIGRAAMGERLGGFIYGTILVLSVVIAGAKAYPHKTGHIAALVLGTSVVFWLAHVYAHSVGQAVAQDQHLSLGEFGHIAHREASIVEAALPPFVALLLGAINLISDNAAIWAALVLGLLVLGAQGLAVARVERMGLVGTLLVVAGNAGIGLLLIAVKLAVSHH